MTVVEFAANTSLHQEPDRRSQFPIVGNGPPGTFVIFAHRLRVSLPTDQIVWADDSDGRARVRFGGMRFEGVQEGQLLFRRVRELQPEAQLSPDRSHVMTLATEWVASIEVEGRTVWPEAS